MISEIKLRDLVKKVWDKFVYTDDPKDIIKRLKNAGIDPQNSNLPVDILPKKSTSQLPTRKRKQKGPEQLRFNLGKKRKKSLKQKTFSLPDGIKMPERINKLNWKEGFDITKPPFYTDNYAWYINNFNISDGNLHYIGEDLNTYGFKLKPGDTIKIDKFDRNDSLYYMNEWNKAKAYQIYYTKKIEDFMLKKIQKKTRDNN